MGFLIQKIGEREWQPFIRARNALFEPETLLRGCSLEVEHGPFVIRLDTRQHAQNHMDGTSYLGEQAVGECWVRVAVTNSSAFHCEISREGATTSLIKMLGAEEVELGIPEFDDAFWLKTNSPAILADLLTPDLRAQLLAHRTLAFVMRHKDRGLFGGQTLPEGVDLILYESPYLISNCDELEAVFGFFEALLDRLVELEVIDFADPGVIWR